MGGQTSLYVTAVLAPERVTKLVDVAGVVVGKLCAGPKWGIYPGVAFGKGQPWFYRLFGKLSRFRAFMPISTFRFWFYDLKALSFESWEIDRQMATQPGIHISVYEAGQAIHNLNLTPQLSKISVPTLIIFGQQDANVPVSDGHLAAQHIPDSRLVLIDRCGHFPMYEQTEHYLEALRDFL